MNEDVWADWPGCRTGYRADEDRTDSVTMLLLPGAGGTCPSQHNETQQGW